MRTYTVIGENGASSSAVIVFFSSVFFVAFFAAVFFVDVFFFATFFAGAFFATVFLAGAFFAAFLPNRPRIGLPEGDRDEDAKPHPARRARLRAAVVRRSRGRTGGTGDRKSTRLNSSH